MRQYSLFIIILLLLIGASSLHAQNPPQKSDAGCKKLPTEEEVIARNLNSGKTQKGGEDGDRSQQQQQECTPDKGSKSDQQEEHKQQKPAGNGGGYVQCLQKIGAKLCDPTGIFSAQQKAEIDQTLTELQTATRKEDAGQECAKAGLEAMFIIVPFASLHDEPMAQVQQKLNGALEVWVREHPCQKPVIIMLSTDPSNFNRKVWTGLHYEVPVDPGHLVQLFINQGALTAQQKYSDVILKMIEGLLDKYEAKIGK